MTELSDFNFSTEVPVEIRRRQRRLGGGGGGKTKKVRYSPDALRMRALIVNFAATAAPP